MVRPVKIDQEPVLGFEAEDSIEHQASSRLREVWGGQPGEFFFLQGAILG